MAQHEPIRRGSGGPGGPGRGTERKDIPDKLYFRIGEVAKLCGVPAYVLRFWETEFPQLRPNKGGTGQRLYRRRDVEMALRVKTLLWDEGYTIPGARQALKVELRTGKDPQLALIADAKAEPVDARHLQAIRKELTELHTLLSRPASTKPAVQTIRPPRVKPAPPATPAPKPLSAPHVFPNPAAKTNSIDSLFDQLEETKDEGLEPRD